VLLLERYGPVTVRKGLLAVLVLALGGLTVLRNAEYRNDRTLYAAVLDHSTGAGLGIDPGYNTLINYSELLGADGNLTEAEALLRRAIAQEPGESRAWNNLGIVMGLSNRIPEALEAWTRSTELDPTDPDPILNLARTYDRTGQIEAALAAYRRVQAVSPQPIPEVQQRIDVLQARPGGSSGP
jgi:Flp pilus assembly protein TadD